MRGYPSSDPLGVHVQARGDLPDGAALYTCYLSHIVRSRRAAVPSVKAASFSETERLHPTVEKYSVFVPKTDDCGTAIRPISAGRFTTT